LNDIRGKLKGLFGKSTEAQQNNAPPESDGVLLPMEFDNEGKTRVLIITRRFEGGVKTYLLSLIERLQKDNYRVYAAGPRGSIVDDLKGSKIVTFPIVFDDHFTIFEDWAAVRKLIKIIKTEEIRLVHAHGYKAALLAGLAAKRAETPITLVTLHDFIINEGTGRMKHLYFDIAEHFMPRMVDMLIVVSNALRRRVLEKGKVEGSKVRVINAGVRPISSGMTTSRRVLNIKDVLALNTAAPLIVTVGHLTPQKGVKYLLGAATHILREVPNAQLLVVGDGPQKHELEIMAEKLGVHRKVGFTGWRDDARDIMAAADVIVLPSLIEGMPYSMLEAMVSGTPVVSTSTGGIPELLVDRETGFLVPPKKPRALSDAIVYLLQNKDIAVQMGIAGRRRVEEQFDLKKTLNATTAVYKDLFAELAEIERAEAAALEAKLAPKNAD
jgi:glycosyltransferase involved in cell wall biosynthesis